MYNHRYLTIIFAFFIGVAASSGFFIWQRFQPFPAIEIVTKPPPIYGGEITVTGDVLNPGIYPLRPDDTLSDLLQSTGGLNINSNVSVIMDIHTADRLDEPQRVDINHAEAWLLQALPGIGESRAQSIIDYRGKHGPFHTTAELANVNGIGSGVLETIRDLISVNG
jgi:competence protein ComEA